MWCAARGPWACRLGWIMARCLIGLSRLRGKLARYAERYDLAEVQPLDGALPGPAKLKHWREQVPASFAFSVVLPRVVARLRPGAELDAALAQSVEVARVLQARCVILATPADVRPTKANRERIVELADRLPRHGHILGWQPAGIWELPDVYETADRAGLLAVLDGVRDPLPPGPVAYTRVRTLGQAAQLGVGSLERLAEQLHDRREAFVVVDAPSAGTVRAGLAAMIDRRRAAGPGPALFRPAAMRPLEIDDEEQ